MSWLTDLWDATRKTREAVAGAPVQPRLAAMVPKVEMAKEPFPGLVNGDPFQAGNSYFGVRLAGLHLVQARTFATQMLPLCVCLAEFRRGGAITSVPFSIGPGVIRTRLQSVGISEASEATKAWIELRDLTVVRPTPVGTGNVSLFVGLYSVPSSDTIKTLLNLVSDIGGALGAAAVGPAVKAAETVYGGFTALLGVKDITPMVEALNGRALPGTGSGYLVVANTSPDTLNGRPLIVDGGRLCDGKGSPVSDFDYCLIALERYDTIIEKGTNTAPDLFQDLWQDVQSALVARKENDATEARRKLEGAILASADLIEADRDLLMAGYQALYEKRMTQLGIGAAAGGVRGQSSGLQQEVSKASVPAAGKPRNDLHNALSVVNDRMADAKPLANAALTAVETGRPDDVMDEALALRAQFGAARPKAGQLAVELARASLTAGR